MQTDHVDRILQQWQHERPELDPLAMSIFGRPRIQVRSATLSNLSG